MRKKREMVLWALTLSLVLSSAAVASTLAPARPEDQVPSVLLIPVLDAAPATTERAAVSFSWAIDPAAALDLSSHEQSARSREYWIDVPAAELAKGVEIFTTAPGALVRLQPAGTLSDPASAARALDPRTLVVITPDGATLPAEQASDQLATAEQLAAAEAPFAEGTSVFRLRSELGAGRFLLTSEAMADSDGHYIVHVFDRGSDLELVVASARADYLAGDALELSANLEAPGELVAAEVVDGFVASPTGRTMAVTFRRGNDGRFRATLPLPTRVEGGTRGLWELIASARGRRAGHLALRTARVGFAVATPTARLGGVVTLESPAKRGDLAARFEIDVAAPGRYELRGVLFGSAADGVRRPAAVAHTAAWLEAGRGALALRFDPSAVAASGLRGPWELRGLELRDQGRMGLLERRLRGVELAP